MRRPCRIVLPIALSLSLALAPLSPSSVLAAPCWHPPVAGQVVDHFRAPDCPYCAGNRGIEFRIDGLLPVRAVEAGVVTFSGSVAGTAYVVIEHANGWKVTYGRLGGVRVERGQRVVRGARLGMVREDLYFGLRINGEYRDPEPFVGRRIGRPRLVPLDGTARRSPPRPTWVCGP